MNNRIYIGNLSWTTTEEDLQDTFAQVGPVQEAKLIRDRDTQKSKGFAFVTFQDEPSAQKAISMFDQTDLMGRTIKVSIAEQKQRTNNYAAGGGGNRAPDRYR